ncbi:hypothetical protein [Kibdelosporangium phytohabitans]|uniref:hypothetical protein n=1 Tax=Kibdelosporangium phytohabitans TaxID=860235 RepID=UPI0014700694|nr:hypothetical protein [Kibdelosporangium phytohabitans]MBE1463219.1 hypothetical protein [Kibdelosporangium phytohabitans]
MDLDTERGNMNTTHPPSMRPERTHDVGQRHPAVRRTKRQRARLHDIRRMGKIKRIAGTNLNLNPPEHPCPARSSRATAPKRLSRAAATTDPANPAPHSGKQLHSVAEIATPQQDLILLGQLDRVVSGHLVADDDDGLHLDSQKPVGAVLGGRGKKRPSEDGSIRWERTDRLLGRTAPNHRTSDNHAQKIPPRRLKPGSADNDTPCRKQETSPEPLARKQTD